MRGLVAEWPALRRVDRWAEGVESESDPEAATGFRELSSVNLRKILLPRLRFQSASQFNGFLRDGHRLQDVYHAFIVPDGFVYIREPLTRFFNSARARSPRSLGFAIRFAWAKERVFLVLVSSTGYAFFRIGINLDVARLSSPFHLFSEAAKRESGVLPILPNLLRIWHDFIHSSRTVGKEYPRSGAQRRLRRPVSLARGL